MAYLTLGRQQQKTPEKQLNSNQNPSLKMTSSLVKSMAYLKGSKNSKSFSSSPTYSTDRP